MSGWLGANVVAAEESQQRNRDERHFSQHVPSETVEAALNRLSKAYQSATVCIAAWHRAGTAPFSSLSSETTERAVVDQLTQVGRTARRTLEEAVLRDPLISHLLHSMRSELDDGCHFSHRPPKRANAPTLTSGSHQALVKQLAYLSLVNYSDLLLAGLPIMASLRKPSHSRSLLDRGVVAPLPIFRHASCWDESAVAVARRALLALLDATALDDTDPVVWLKLACTARRLGRLTVPSTFDDETVLDERMPVECFLKHRRLEGHALEQGMVCLPDNVPPNRLIVQALTEWQAENDQLSNPHLTYPPRLYSIEKELPEQELCVSLSRYSWSALARILLRCCRDGTLAAEPIHPRHHHEHRRHHTAPSPISTSGRVRMQLSPVLALPSTALARICQFLPDSHIWRFEATCRALSYSILSARTTTILEDRVPTDRSHVSAVSSELRGPTLGGTGVANPSATLASGETNTSAVTAQTQPTQASRVSKRLQTQLMTSGRRSDRRQRRTSVEYCLVAATLGCTPESPVYQDAKKSDPWHFFRAYGVSFGEAREMDASQRSDNRRPKGSVNEKLQRQREEARERISDSSLLHFVQRYNRTSNHTPYTPLEVLFGFVAHVSVHIGDVFMTDPGGTMVLTSSLLECIDILLSYCHAKDAFSPSWSNGELPILCGAGLCRRELFAVDLLHAELRLRRCDREDAVENRCNGDGNIVTALISSLPVVMDELDTSSPSFALGGVDWTRLKARCIWFQSNYYLWRSRISRCLVESREAECIGLDLIEQAISAISAHAVQPEVEVPVPHLASPSRSEACWKALTIPSLVAFRNDIQAASVVLQSREQFVEIVSQIDKQDTFGELGRTQEKALYDIGESLLQRYGTPAGCLDAKHVELVDDFLSIHGEDLSVMGWDSDAGDASLDPQSWINQLLPIGKRATLSMVLSLSINSSILSILLVCLQTSESGSLKITALLVRLITTIADISRNTLQRVSQADGETSSNRSGGDEDSSVSSYDDPMRHHDQASQRGDLMKLRQLSVLLVVLVYRLRDVIRDYLVESELALFSKSPEGPEAILQALSFCSELVVHLTKRSVDLSDDRDDTMIFKAVHSLARVLDLRGESAMTRDERFHANRCFLEGLVVVVVKQRRALETLLQSPTGRQGRASRLQRIRRRADFLAHVCCRLGLALSLQPSALRVGSMLLQYNVFDDRAESTWKTVGPVICESLIWLWNTALNDETCTLKDRLIVPVATAIAGYCGCATNCSPCSGVQESMREFFDSDDSAMDFVSESESEQNSENRSHRVQVLRVISQAVHCVDNTFGSVDDNEAMTYSRCDHYLTRSGPSLPLVVSRILNNFAELLLREFYDKDSKPADAQDPVWSDYPDGVRTTGQLIDSLLYKSYRCLHGFALVHASDSKDIASTGSRPLGRRFQPESLEAAVRLYRCIMRAYSNGRRSPPKVALDMVVDALPPLQESEKRLEIRSYLFSNNRDYFNLDDLMMVVAKCPGWEDLLQEKCGVSWTVLENGESLGSSDDCTTVRRGISRLLAQAPLSTNQEGATDRDERIAATLAEDEFSRKFSAIIDDLSLGETNDFEGWFKAAQCLIGKADVIADRIGLTKGFSRSLDFVVRERLSQLERKVDLSQLLQQQKATTTLESKGWVSSLGFDLSAYCRFCWSSFSSLQSAMVEIGSLKAPSYFSKEPKIADLTADAQSRRINEELEALWTHKELVLWQQAWGGLFVSSLRKVAYRCMFLALSFAYKQEDTSAERSQGLIVQIFEVLGTMLYSELSGSQVYGYPMRSMPRFIQRETALASLSCYEKAVDIAATSDSRVTWDLLFMIGKCNEKIAFTYNGESFVCSAADGTASERHFERFMSRAFQAYSDSLAAARLNEKEGLLSEQNGGSCHGSAEVLYRLHASRLKCLISAVNRREEETDLAEAEALRLTEMFWFMTPKDIPSETRDRVWAVLSDVVGALVQCRNDFSFFHRSVYRHAQALMWAPVLFDPKTDRRQGSLGTVPASRACSLRGMNSSNAANSALTVIASLFEKKRQQLVAVWVTASGDDSPFQAVNSTIRKYDSLRGKYISAYLDCLRLCTKKAELETFLRWTFSCNRDQPSYFSASAATQGGPPQRGQVEDSLLATDHRSLTPYHFLTSTKRQVNGALASVIASDLESSSDAKKAADSLKEAYACFLRLKCSADDLVRSSSWKYLHTGNVAVDLGNRCIKEVVDALTYAFTQSNTAPLPSVMQSDWSDQSQMATSLLAALKKGKELFPSLSTSLYSKKASSPKRKKPATMSAAAAAQSLSTEHLKSYQVTVPSGLEVGKTFVVAVNDGGRSRKVRLTVPDQPVKVMRFTLPASPSGPTKTSKDEVEATRHEPPALAGGELPEK